MFIASAGMFFILHVLSVFGFFFLSPFHASICAYELHHAKKSLCISILLQTLNDRFFTHKKRRKKKLALTFSPKLNSFFLSSNDFILCVAQFPCTNFSQKKSYNDIVWFISIVHKTNIYYILIWIKFGSGWARTIRDGTIFFFSKNINANLTSIEFE